MIGVMALVIVMSVMNGFNDNIRTKMLAVEPHLVALENDSVPIEKIKSVIQSEKNNLEKYQVFETQDIILKTLDGRFGGAVAKGLSQKSLNELRDRVNTVHSNTRLDSSVGAQMDLQPGQIIMGYDLAQQLNIFEGDEVVIIPPESLFLPAGEVPVYERVQVVQLLTTELQDIDARFLFYNRAHTLTRFKGTASREVGYEVRFPDPDHFRGLKSKLVKLGARTESWRDRNAALFFALKMEKLVMTIFLSLATLITSFSMVTVLVLLMTQKRKDIGVLMAMGFSRRQTQILFSGIGLFLTVLGLGGGLVFGLGVSFYMQHFPLNILPDIYYDSTIPAIVDLELISVVVGVSALVGLIGAILPVHLHIRMTPVEAIRGPKT
jgi:lipoprotein-releasing system permease protein